MQRSAPDCKLLNFWSLFLLAFASRPLSPSSLILIGFNSDSGNGTQLRDLLCIRREFN